MAKIKLDKTAVYKYQEYLDKYKNCPSEKFNELDCSAFRWVFKDPTDFRNFLPVLEMNPKRLNSKKFDKDTMKCRGYALSLYESEQEAISSHESIFSKNIKRKPELISKTTTHISKVTIKKTDGKRDDCDKYGHFDFYEYVGCDFYKQIIETKEIDWTCKYWKEKK